MTTSPPTATPESPSWVAVGSEDDVQTAPWPVVDVDGADIMIVRDGQTLHAVAAICPHLLAPMTAAEVTPDRIACTRHWYEYRLCDGENVHPGGPSAGIEVRPLRVTNGVIEIQSAMSPQP